jgi:hypothetical protein
MSRNTLSRWRGGTLKAVACLCGFIIALVAPAYAHHSASSEYDVNRTVQVTGVMTQMEWINPHAEMHMDVKNTDGTVTPWIISFAGLSKLRLAGMNKSTLSVGTKYTVIGNPGRQGLHKLLVNSVTFPDGHVFQLAAPEGNEQ